MSRLATPGAFGWRRAVWILASAVSAFAWVATVRWLYRSTADHPLLQPWNIIAGKSRAPYQYRVLEAVAYWVVKNSLALDSVRADNLVVVGSMAFCLGSTGLLYYRSSRSWTMASLAQLALLGSFTFGMVTRARQEFFEVALVCAALSTLLELKSQPRMYALLALITALGSLNRETFVCALCAIFAHVLWRRRVAPLPKPALRAEALGLAVLTATFVGVTVGLRAYFGLSSYAVPFWMLRNNLRVSMRLGSPGHVLNMGSGTLAAFLASLSAGNREYLPFVIGYSVPLLLLASLAANLSEHRIFYPMMALMVASMTRFSRRQNCGEIGH